MRRVGYIEFSLEILRERLGLPNDAVITGVRVNWTDNIQVKFTSIQCPEVHEGLEPPRVTITNDGRVIQ